jgi:hypothetical protein
MQKTKVLYHDINRDVYANKTQHTLLLVCEVDDHDWIPLQGPDGRDCFIVDGEGSAILDHVSDERLISELMKRGAK